METDLYQAIKAVDGNKELLRELASDFMDDFPKQLAELAEMIRKGDAGQVERTAHSLKGSVGIFGVQSAYDLAYDLENRGREDELDGAQDVFQKLESELMKLKQFFSMPGWEQNC